MSLDYAQGRPTQRLVALWRGEISAEVEEVVLDATEHGVEIGVAGCMETCDADGGVRFINRAIAFDAEIPLLDAFAGREARGAVVAGARVDLVQDNHGAGSHCTPGTVNAC